MMAKRPKVSLPENIYKFVQAGTVEGPRLNSVDTTVPVLLQHVSHFLNGDLPRGGLCRPPRPCITKSAIEVCLELEVRLAGGYLIQAARMLEAKNAKAARACLERAEQAIKSAREEAAKYGQKLAVTANDIYDATAVLHYQIDILEHPDKV